MTFFKTFSFILDTGMRGYDRGQSGGGSTWSSNPIQKPFGSSGAPKPWSKEPWRPDNQNDR